MKRIELNKQVFSKPQFEDVVDTQFTELISQPDETLFDPNLATVEDFFIIYENLFYNIPKTGDINSHEYLIKKSTDYTGYEAENTAIQPLLDEIASLREENLELRQQNIDLIQTSILSNR